MKINTQNITKPQSNIVKAICIHQMDSLTRLISDYPLDDTDLTLYFILIGNSSSLTLYLAKNNLPRELFIEDLEEQMEKFEELYNNPDDLRFLDKTDISNFKHWLANLEKKYKKKYPNAVSNLWSRLNLITNIQDKKLNAFDMN